MKLLLTTAIVTFALFRTHAIQVQTMFKGSPDKMESCCIELAHVYYTDDYEYIGIGTSYVSLNDDLCCAQVLGEVIIDEEAISQFQKDKIPDVYAFNETEAFKRTVARALLKYRLSLENKMGKIEVSQNPISGKLSLKFQASEAGTMELAIEPMGDSKKFYYGTLKVNEGWNETEIDYVPFSQSKSPISLRIALLSEIEGFRAVFHSTH